MDGFDLAGVVVSADALHCQRDTAGYIIGRDGHYVLTVKDNQRGLRRQLKALPWKDISAITAVDTGHGRRVRRTVKPVQAPGWIDFPGATQVLQIRRTRTVKKRTSTEVVYAICSLPMADAPAAVAATWTRGHWSIESCLHWVRDTVFDEDHHQLRTGRAPQVMATLRNATIRMIRLAGQTGIAKALRYNSRHPARPIELILQTT